MLYPPARKVFAGYPGCRRRLIAWVWGEHLACGTSATNASGGRTDSRRDPDAFEDGSTSFYQETEV